MLTKFQSRLSPLVLLIAAVAVFVLSMVFMPQYSSFTAGLIKLALVIGGSVAFDVFVLRNSNTFEQIVEKQNVAYAVFFGAVIIALGAAVSTL